MQKISSQKLLRIVDANFNRAKEGLRVCEDVCRFVLDDQYLTKQYKQLRHRLTVCVEVFGLKVIVKARDIENDVGRSSTKLELKRAQVSDIFYANSQRVKESIRVLEEFAKLKDAKLAQHFKKMRYQIYGLEKRMVEKG